MIISLIFAFHRQFLRIFKLQLDLRYILGIIVNQMIVKFRCIKIFMIICLVIIGFHQLHWTVIQMNNNNHELCMNGCNYGFDYDVCTCPKYDYCSCLGCRFYGYHNDSCSCPYRHCTSDKTFFPDIEFGDAIIL